MAIGRWERELRAAKEPKSCVVSSERELGLLLDTLRTSCAPHINLKGAEEDKIKLIIREVNQQ